MIYYKKLLDIRNMENINEQNFINDNDKNKNINENNKVDKLDSYLDNNKELNNINNSDYKINIEENKNENFNQDIKNFNDIKESNKINYNEIYNLEQLDKVLKIFFLENKEKLIKPKHFIEYGNKIYKKYKMFKKFKMAEYHLKNLYQKFKISLLPKNLSEIYNYANSFEDIGPIARSYEVKIITNENNERLEHKHIIFFIDYHFKRIFSSKHILIDCTFIFPLGYIQTMIIMYYDKILYRFIPGIFVLIITKPLNIYLEIL